MRSAACRRVIAATSIAALPVLTLAVAQAPSGAAGADLGGGIVSEMPKPGTPHVMDGTVLAITQVGSKIVVGGDFTSVSPSSSYADTSDDVTRHGLFAFDASTGRIDSSFNPDVEGEVHSLDTDGTYVYASGAFGSVGGDASIRRLVKLNMSGDPVSAFDATPSAVTNEVVVRGSRVYIGGGFTSIASRGATYAVGQLAVLNASTGTPDLTAMDLAFSGVYNPGAADPGSTNVKRFDVTRDGTRLAAVGNFTTVGGQTRNQLAVFDVSGARASLTSFDTNRFDRTHSVCTEKVDTFTRDIDFSPDGSFFVVTTTGAYGRGASAGSLCDTSTRWETGQTSNDPTWIAYTGGDTTYGVAVTGEVVYLGGHMRWQNNPWQADQAGPGAVGREGIAALDAVNGMPLTWNPGRERGVGAQALFATSQGLWVGSDTTLFNNQRRGRVAFLPAAGGDSMPCEAPARLPNSLYAFPTSTSAGGYVRRTVDASGVPTGPVDSLASTTDWSRVRGAFALDGVLYYGMTDNAIYKRSFDAETGELGPATLLDLHDDPDDGARIPWQIPSMSGMFYDPATHRIFFTVAGDSHLYYRGFSPQSEIVGAQPFPAPAGGVNFSRVAGMTLADGRILYGSTDGKLRSVPFDHGRVTGSPGVISADGTWSLRALFVGNDEAQSCTSPIAQGDMFTTPTDTSLTVPAPGVLDNDWDPQAGSELTVSDVGQASHGQATVSANGALAYVPASGFRGTDSLTYRVTDDQGHTSAPATVTIFVGTSPIIPDVPGPATPRIALSEGAGLKAGSNQRSGTFPITFTSGATLSATSSNGRLVAPTAVKIRPGRPGTALVTVTASRKARGRAVVTVFATIGGKRAPITITVVVGTNRRDHLKGTAGPDLLVGLRGDDRLVGRAGRDVLCGGPGRDKLVGGPGADAQRR